MGKFGKISKIEISVQNNSLIFPGMCEGCNKSMFATGKDKWKGIKWV